MLKQISLEVSELDEINKKLEGLHLQPDQLKVFKAIKMYHPGGVPDKQIAKHTGLPITSVCARRNKLIEFGLVKSVGFDYFPDYNGMTRRNKLWALDSS